jgi:ABC-type sulfate transport system permease component
MVVFQSLGGALVVSAGQSIFQNRLLSSLAVTSPQIAPARILGIGASEIQNMFGNELPGINESYMNGLHMAFALGIAMGGAATIVAGTQKWFTLNPPGDSGNTLVERSEVDLSTEKH